MDTELMIIYSSLIMILISSFLFFHAAFNIQKKKGVIVGNFSPIFLFFPVIVIFQFYLRMVELEVDLIYWTGVIVVFLILMFLFSYLLWNRREIAVYDIKQEEVIAVLESELTNMSIPFKIKNGFHSEEIVFSLNEEGSKIIIKGGILGEERKTYNLTFKKWRQFQKIEELHYNIKFAFREKQKNKVFWTHIVTNCSLGLVSNVAVIYLFVKLF